MPEFAFDVRLDTVVRVTADSLEAAEAAARSVQAVDVCARIDIDGTAGVILLTEVSVDPASPLELFEVDGDDPADRRLLPQLR
ncbi:hypothetical protein GTY62_00105 [Streptomyces sp. SID724]|uniref:hypothetical protein n=1 Tax=Streptomyces sp. SID724 TaxID=2690324 RepID=UPI001361E422|nr:hypothetical protein [Streptomyces sp. SID724]